VSLTPPTPPTGSHDDPDSGWLEYTIALEDYEKAVVRERVLATAVQMAVRKDQPELALALLDCEIVAFRPWEDDAGSVTADIESSVEAFQTLQEENASQGDWDSGIPSRLYYFLYDLLPSGMRLGHVVIRPRLAQVEDGWRERVRATIEGEASNQGTSFGTSRTILHKGLYYRSQSEVKVAEALEKVDGVLFFPNSGSMWHGVHKEPDFLVFYKGKVGVLEVDGPTHIGRAADDSARDSYFERHGLWVKHYPAEACYNEPGVVVGSFLSLLAKS